MHVEPEVSVLVPMRCAERLVREAIASVLEPQGAAVEVIVVDDHSTDGSAAAVEGLGDPRVRLLRSRGRGIAAALNTGWEAARALYVARCDADDRYPPGRLAEQLAWLREHPDYGAVCGAYATLDARGRFVATLANAPPGREITELLREGGAFTHLCTFLMRREVGERLGGFREWFATAEDVDFQLRTAEHFRVWYEPRTRYLHRLRADSVTHSQRSASREFYDAAARHFARERRSEGMDALERGRPPEPPPAGSDERRSAAAHVERLLAGRAWREHGEGRRLRAWLTGLEACRRRPASRDAWRNLAALTLRAFARPRRPASSFPESRGPTEPRR